MMSVGDHSLQLVNETLGYRLSRTVNVAPGRVTSMRLDPPKGTLALNAAPWAEVWVDGDRVGDTPMGNISLQIGSHDVLFRHPELGEQRHTVTVTLKGGKSSSPACSAEVIGFGDLVLMYFPFDGNGDGGGQSLP